MKTPFFQNDPVPLKFKVKAKSGDVVLSSATVCVYSGTKEVITDAPCELEDEMVLFTVPSGITEAPGNYRADFTIHFKPDITRSHIIRFHIAQRGAIISKEADMALMPVDENAAAWEVSGAVAEATRHLRRAGVEVVEAARITRDLAEQMTGERR